LIVVEDSLRIVGEYVKMSAIEDPPTMEGLRNRKTASLDDVQRDAETDVEMDKEKEKQVYGKTPDGTGTHQTIMTTRHTDKDSLDVRSLQSPPNAFLHPYTLTHNLYIPPHDPHPPQLCLPNLGIHLPSQLGSESVLLSVLCGLEGGVRCGPWMGVEAAE
jgi:hypothetical protein